MIGRLRHRLTIEAPVETSDGGGGRSTGWSTVATVWGHVSALSGNERLRAMQLESRVSHRIVIRHRAEVTARHRIRFGARLFNIRAVIDRDQTRRFLEVLAEEGVAT